MKKTILKKQKLYIEHTRGSIRMMKKRLFRMMTVTILLLCLFGAAAAEESNEETSGLEITDSSEITEDARAAF